MKWIKSITIKKVENSPEVLLALEEIKALGQPFPFDARLTMTDDGMLEVYARGNQIHLAAIDILPEKRGQGLASQTLKQVLAIADKYGVVVDLEADPYGRVPGLTEEQLVDWYQRNEFDYKSDESNILIRQPKSLEAKKACSVEEELAQIGYDPAKAGNTQNKKAVRVTKKAEELLINQDIVGPVLDYGAGFGQSNEILKQYDITLYEPYPKQDVLEQFGDSILHLPEGKYMTVINSFVLNVCPPILRDSIVASIASKVASGGSAIIGARPASEINQIIRVNIDNPKYYVLQCEESSYYSYTKKSYQHGFTQDELRNYIQSIMGGEFMVGDLSITGVSAVIATKLKKNKQGNKMKNKRACMFAKKHILADDKDKEIKDLQKEVERLTEELYTDALTSLNNKRFLLEKVEGLVEGKDYSMMVFDIDNFKSVNDEHGHDVGDEVLKAVAQKVQEQANDGDYVARFGGEEFVVLTIEKDEDYNKDLAEEIRASIEALEVSGLNVTISGGIANGKGQSIQDTFATADEALYESKENGKNQITVHSSNMTHPYHNGIDEAV